MIPKTADAAAAVRETADAKAMTTAKTVAVIIPAEAADAITAADTDFLTV